MTCPSNESLLRMALSDGLAADALHVRTCTACTEKLNRLGKAMSRVQSVRQTRAPTASCLDDLAVADMLSSPSSSLEPHVQHLTECAYCRSNLAGAAAALRAPEVAREIARLQTEQPRPLLRWPRMAAVAAVFAGAALLPLLLRQDDRNSAGFPDQLRDSHPSITMSAPPEIVSPEGTVTRANALIWTHVAGATRYDITVFDRNGEVVWATEATDTAIALPDRIALTPGEAYFWKVAAHMNFNRSVDSELIQFVVRPPTP
jgi:hypothetical protein